MPGIYRCSVVSQLKKPFSAKYHKALSAEKHFLRAGRGTDRNNERRFWDAGKYRIGKYA
jgi:hypothetical protein